MWVGTYASVAPSVHTALTAAESLAPGKLDRSGSGTLVGYSNGAYFAVEIARSEPGKWTGLVLVSMRLDLDGAALRAAGVRRILLAAGERDGARGSMQALARSLDTVGLPTRFMRPGRRGGTSSRATWIPACARRLRGFAKQIPPHAEGGT
jgi:pimeloyl-ACP methyl ester carboxylesterase